MVNSEIEAIERNIKQAKVNADFGAAVERLKGNRDFQKVVLSGYFEQEAIRLVHLKADPNMQAPEKQASLVSQMDAIGAFKAFLDTALFKAEIATNSIESSEATLAEIYAEEAAEGVR